MGARLKSIESKLDGRETQLLSLTLACATDFEICKSLRIGEETLGSLWESLYARYSVQERVGVISALFGQTVAAVWKSKQDLEVRLHGEIFDRETEQALLNEITLTTNTGGWTMDLTSGQVIWTRGINAILNRPLDAKPLEPKAVQALVHPEDQPMHRKAVERLMSEGTAFNITYRFVVDGEVKHIRSVTKALFSPDGKLVRIFGTITDETETLRLRDSERTGRRMMETIAGMLPDTVYVFDMDKQETVYSNRNMAASLGYNPQDAQDMGNGFPTALLNPSDIQPFSEFREQLATLGARETREIEVRLKHIEGHWVHCILRKVAFAWDSEGRVTQILTTVHDVTALRASREALMESEETLAKSFQDAPIGMAILSLDGTFEKVNRAYAQMCGYEMEEVVGQNILIVNDSDEVSLYLDYLCEAMADPKMPPYRREKQSIRKDGSRIWVSLTCSLVWNAEGRPVRVISQVQDITVGRMLEDVKRDQARHVSKIIDSVSEGDNCLSPMALVTDRKASAKAA